MIDKFELSNPKCPYGCEIDDFMYGIITDDDFKSSPMEKEYLESWIYWYDLTCPDDIELYEWWNTSLDEILTILNKEPSHMSFGNDDKGIWVLRKKYCSGISRIIQSAIKECKPWNFFKIRTKEESVKYNNEKKEEEIWPYIKALSIQLRSLRNISSVSAKRYHMPKSDGERGRKDAIHYLTISCIDIMSYIVKMTGKPYSINPLELM